MHFLLHIRFYGSLFLLATGLLAGCSVDVNSPKFVVAETKNVKITRAELEATKAKFVKQHKINTAQMLPAQVATLEQQMAQQLVLQSLLFQEAENLKLSQPDIEAALQKIKDQSGGDQGFQKRLDEVGATMENFKEDLRKQLRMQQVIDAKVPPASDPSEEAIQKFYEANKSHFMRAAGVRINHILVAVPRDAAPALKAEKKKKINAARTRIAKGEDFAKVAKEMSEDPASAARGGDLGFFAKGNLFPEFEKVASSTKVGAVSAIFETQYGYHILRVREQVPGGLVPLQEQRPGILGYLKSRQHQEDIQAYLKKIEADAKVVYHLPKADAQAHPAASKPSPK